MVFSAGVDAVHRKNRTTLLGEPFSFIPSEPDGISKSEASMASKSIVLSRTGGRVVGWVAGALLASYALNYLAQIWELIRPWGRLSILHYYDPARITARGEIPLTTVAVLGSVVCVLTGAAHVLAERRELAP